MNDKFNPNNFDIKVHSVDGIEFELHRTLLEACTGVFPGLESSTEGNSAAIQLTEPGNVLSVLFDFIYPREHPDLEDENFEFVVTLAEAVMKYEVYSAVYTCNTRMRSFLPSHAADIFVYALKHNHTKLADAAALYIARSPLVQTVDISPVDCLLPWIKYREQWTMMFTEARRSIKSMPSTNQFNLCHSGSSICDTCRISLYNFIASLEELNSPFALEPALIAETLNNISLPCCRAPTGFVIPQIWVFGNPVPGKSLCDHIVTLAKICHEKIVIMPPFSKYIIGQL